MGCAKVSYLDMKKLTFVCVGAQKAGTSSLDNILRKHPYIYLPRVKETKFFQGIADSEYYKGEDWYWKTYFPRKNEGKILGEVDPEYLYFEEVPKRLYKHNNDLKIIIILRNPVKRAFSHYLMSLNRGYENHSFVDAISLEQNRIKHSEFNKNHFSYVSRGFYFNQINRYIELFGKDNIIVLDFDSFLNNQAECINKIINFISIKLNKMHLKHNIHSNVSHSPKYKRINEFVYRKNILKTVGKKILPNRFFRQWILETIDKLNRKRYCGPSLEIETEIMLINIFKSDIKKVDLLIGQTFYEKWVLRS
jgi:sulfotransferase family protein